MKKPWRTELPGPPLKTSKDAAHFGRMLGAYLRELKKPGEPIGMLQFTLGMVVEYHTAGIECGRCGVAYPCPTVLLIAGRTKFPLSWSPYELASLMSSHEKAYGYQVFMKPGLIAFGDGEDQVAFTQKLTEWEYRSQSRARTFDHGSVDDRQVIDTLLKLAMPRPYPYGWQDLPDRDIASLRAGVPDARAAWNEHAALPYLESERHHGVPTD